MRGVLPCGGRCYRAGPADAKPCFRPRRMDSAAPAGQGPADCLQGRGAMAGRRIIDRRVIERGEARIEVLAEGEGPAVLLLASLGRGAEDFDEVAPLVAAAGFRVVRREPRGIGASTGPMEGLTLYDLAEDAAAALLAMGSAPAIIAGHAFGNWVARALATARPELA